MYEKKEDNFEVKPSATGRYAPAIWRKQVPENPTTFVVSEIPSFPADNLSYIFANKLDAKEFLLQLWEDACNAAYADALYSGERPKVCKKKTYHEEEYGVLTWDSGDSVQFVLSAVANDPVLEKRKTC